MPAEINIEWIEGMAILITVIAIVLVTSFNDWSKERQFRGLKSKIDSEQKINVWRNGNLIELQIRDLLVGDICQLYYGNTIPADGIIIESNDLRVDESSLTGETKLVKKAQDKDFALFSGTNVMEGVAKMLVTSVGIHSQIGIIVDLMGASGKTKNKTKKSPMEEERERIILSHENLENEMKFKKRTKSILQIKLAKLTLKLSYAGKYFN